VIEPREEFILAGAFVLVLAGAASTHWEWSGAIGPAGVGEQGIGTFGFPRNVGDPVVSKGKSGWRYRVNNSRPDVAALSHAGAKRE
jgi:hypothetical protein